MLENEKIERHIMKNIPGGHNLFVQDKEVASLIENLYSVSITLLLFSFWLLASRICQIFSSPELAPSRNEKAFFSRTISPARSGSVRPVCTA